MIVLIGTGFYSCLFAQDENTNTSPNKPNVQIRVNKQTDKDGNITSYDSVYTYTFDGNQADTGLVNSMMKNNLGNMSIRVVPGNAMPSFMTDPFFQQNNMDMSIDMDRMQKMMQKQMQELMQNAGMYNMQDFFQKMQKPVPEPKKCPKQQNCQPQKCQPKNNVINGGVQI